MGNCVLVRRDQNSDSKFKWSVGSDQTVVNNVNVPTEPNKPIVWEKEIQKLCSTPLSLSMNHVASSPEFSKRDEIFFDSQAWLDSDNEDFFSVNGDNTPSCGSTPVWRPNAVETQPAEQSPKDAKKLLIELFRESFNSEQERSSSIVNTTSNRHVELVNVEANNNKPITSRRSRSVKGKLAQSSTPWCIPVPKLARSLSLGDKKKRLLSPCHGGGRVDL